ncbi:hypothetical protein [Bacillus cereus]|uniref:hypothetical protein n=1 Tax=Bacillus cereus TaxID=1396 RepID=UPI000B4AA8B0|nr:hypothetical protein [Bacillus cereus]
MELIVFSLILGIVLFSLTYLTYRFFPFKRYLKYLPSLSGGMSVLGLLIMRCQTGYWQAYLLLIIGACILMISIFTFLFACILEVYVEEQLQERKSI